MARPSRNAWWKLAWEIVVPAACVYTWFWCLYEAAPKESMWADELLTHILVTDKSVANMLDAVAEGVDGSPPGYWLTTWAWEKIAGGTPMALRFLTTAWVSVAFVASWVTFRRRYGFHAASIATTTVYFLAPVLWRHAFEARHYGLLVAGVALTNLTAEVLFDTDGKRRGPWIANALANALVVNTHLFGFFYAGCTALAFAIADLRQRRIRWKLWASFVAGWVTFLPWLPSLKRQQKSTEWGFWTPVPKPEDLTSFRAYIQDFPLAKLALVLLAFGVLALVLRAGVASKQKARTDVTSPAPIAGLLYVFLVPSIAWWLSVHRPTSVWHERYMSPQFLGWAALMAVALDRLGTDRPLKGSLIGRFLRTSAMLAATLYFVRYMISETKDLARARPPSSIAPLDTGGLPVAAEMSHRVLEQWYYAPQVDMSYLLDASTAQKVGGGTAIDYKIMSALGRHYPVKTVPVEVFLARNPKFLHLETGGWFAGVLGTTRGTEWKWKSSGWRGGLTLVEREEK